MAIDVGGFIPNMAHNMARIQKQEDLTDKIALMLAAVGFVRALAPHCRKLAEVLFRKTFGSKDVDIDRSCYFAHLMFARLRCRVWFEYIESKANWADEPSREGLSCKFCAQHGFQLKYRPVDASLLNTPIDELLSVVSSVWVRDSNVAGSVQDQAG